MPFRFILPTTAACSFSSFCRSETHPSLTLAASTHRAVVRDALKTHKRLQPAEQAAHLATVEAAIDGYIPYLLALDEGLGTKNVNQTGIDVLLISEPAFNWRAIISEVAYLGRHASRLKLPSLEYEIDATLMTLACIKVLSARSALRLLYTSASASPSAEERTTAITTATKHLLLAGAITQYLTSRSDHVREPAPAVDVQPSTFRALTSLALAEATLLAVLKDDPYPAAVAQDRNKNDNEWMIKTPDMPKVRAHLFARLCLSAADHARSAAGALSTSDGAPTGKVSGELVRYVQDLRRAARAKAYRFFAIDADMSGKTGEALAWCMAGRAELGYEAVEVNTKKTLSLGRLKKEWSEKRDDRRVEQESNWGNDASRAEEGRVLDMLSRKWTKMNDTVSYSSSGLDVARGTLANESKINTQVVPPYLSLISQMPSGREIHTLQPYTPPRLDAAALQDMRAPPDHDEVVEGASSEDEEATDPPGAFPGSGRYY